MSSPATYSRRSLISLTEPFRSKRNTDALAIFLLDILLYVALTGVTLTARFFGVRLAASFALGIVLARLFIIGHDCCHGAFFSSATLNRALGRVAFLPTLTPFSLWELGHNVMHHSFPNLKGRDHVWAPLTKSEYEALPSWRKALERFYRSIYGLWAYYLIELWWNKLFFPNKRHVRARRSRHLRDSWAVALYLVAMISICVWLSDGSAGGRALSLVTAIVIPFCLWNYLMGFVIYVHHTHPAIAWYENKSAWAQSLPQIVNTVHMTFPVPFSKMLHNIMEHNAHHADINVPLYELPSAQASVTEALGPEMLVEQWSFRGFIACLDACKLFDFEQYAWLDFEGNITALTTTGRKSYGANGASHDARRH
jgi:omega-6 fatty acid desaturase (delta-12 desaturase)